MLIAVNAGNSRVLLGGYEEDGQVFSASIATEPKLTRDDYACKLQQVLLLYGVNVRRIHGGIVSSVVPSMVGVLEGALRLLGIRDVIEVSSGVKTGLNIRSEQPRQVGSDRVAAAVAARAKGKLPCVAVTLGTATTFTALDGSGALVGSAITAGRHRRQGRGHSRPEHGRCHARRRGLRCGVARGRYGRTLCGSTRRNALCGAHRRACAARHSLSAYPVRVR